MDDQPIPSTALPTQPDDSANNTAPVSKKWTYVGVACLLVILLGVGAYIVFAKRQPLPANIITSSATPEAVIAKSVLDVAKVAQAFSAHKKYRVTYQAGSSGGQTTEVDVDLSQSQPIVRAREKGSSKQFIVVGDKEYVVSQESPVFTAKDSYDTETRGFPFSGQLLTDCRCILQSRFISEEIIGSVHTVKYAIDIDTNAYMSFWQRQYGFSNNSDAYGMISAPLQLVYMLAQSDAVYKTNNTQNSQVQNYVWIDDSNLVRKVSVLDGEFTFTIDPQPDLVIPTPTSQ